MTPASKSAKSHDEAYKSNGSRCLSDSVREATEKYLQDLDGHEPCELYDLFMAQVEKPLIEVVLGHTRGNVSRAAQVLGLNRGTLRNRLKKYDLDR